jgi:DNA-directed RNA polymerase specialized sigma24 family protein
MNVSGLSVDLLEHDWQRELTHARLRSQFKDWREAEPALSRFADPVALIRFLRAPGASADKDAVLCALLMRARVDPLAARVVLEAVRPGLLRLPARVLVDERQREELWSLLLAVAWEKIRSYPVRRRPRRVAANLLLDTLHQTLSVLRAGRVRLVPCGLDIDPAYSNPSPAHRPWDEGDVDGLLGRAVEAGALAEEEAEIIAKSRIDGVSVEDLARSAGVSYNTMKLRRQRAERRLLVFFGHRPVPRGQQNRPFSSARVVRRGA